MYIGKKIRDLRREMGITQEELGRMLNVGKSTISQYENNINKPDLDMIKQIADIFNVSVDYLFGRTEIREAVSEYVTHSDPSKNNEDQNLNHNKPNETPKMFKPKEETIADEIIELLKEKGYLKEGEILEGEKLEWFKELVDKALDLSRISKPK